MGRKRIPDKWLDYSCINSVIPEARIVPFKCPLPISVCNGEGVPMWTPNDVMREIPNLGLVIDLTNKFPAYYNPNDFAQYGIFYKKIPCVGHFIPKEELYIEFCTVVKSYLWHNFYNNNIIGVHCTHGVNRTGYMICKYLVNELNYSPAQALDIFAQRRGQPLERENYIQNIISLK